MKLTWIGLLALGLCHSSSLFAANERHCDHYAKTAIKQQIANVANACQQKGARWSPLYIEQNAWCKKVRKSISANETKERNKALKKCGADYKNIDFQNRKYMPQMLDWLFDEMKAATKNDDVVAVKVMHAHGVTIHHQYAFNYGDMLYQAVDLQAEKVAKYLISQGGNPKIIHNGGGNSLSEMIKDPRINYRMLAMLLKNGFDPNYGGEGYSDNFFPLLLAAKKNKYRALQMMLKAGGDPNLKRDSTPLMYAIGNRNMSIVRMLVNAGAKVNESGSGESCSLPLDKAIKSGSGAIVSYLKSKGAKCAFCKP